MKDLVKKKLLVSAMLIGLVDVHLFADNSDIGINPKIIDVTKAIMSGLPGVPFWVLQLRDAFMPDYKGHDTQVSKMIEMLQEIQSTLNKMGEYEVAIKNDIDEQFLDQECDEYQTSICKALRLLNYENVTSCGLQHFKVLIKNIEGIAISYSTQD